ncbi:MAG: hypothetical protein WAW37_03985, partial [Syntrophobacteraceae bacterium]
RCGRRLPEMPVKIVALSLMCLLASVFSPVAIMPYLFHFYKKNAIPISKITRENTAHIRKSEHGNLLERRDTL